MRRKKKIPRGKFSSLQSVKCKNCFRLKILFTHSTNIPWSLICGRYSFRHGKYRREKQTGKEKKKDNVRLFPSVFDLLGPGRRQKAPHCVRHRACQHLESTRELVRSSSLYCLISWRNMWAPQLRKVCFSFLPQCAEQNLLKSQSMESEVDVSLFFLNL